MTDLYNEGNPYKVIGTVDEAGYVETSPAAPTSRVLDGSADHSYAAEYIGSGHIGDKRVQAIYLFTQADLDDLGEDGDEGDLPWDSALNRFELLED